MRLLITGQQGTLAPHLAAAARGAGHEVLGWDRAQVPPEDTAAGAAFLAASGADAIAHLALGAESWAATLAAHAASRALPLVFTSTAMVFDHQPDGPHRPDDPRTARDDYGRYKMRCEDAVRGANPDAMVVRIGWQIDAKPRGNNMLAALDGQMQRDGVIRASRRWTPACSFMNDTAAALLAMLVSPQPGVHHLDANATEGHRFDAIVRALAQRFARSGWVVESCDDYAHDQRLLGGTLEIPPLSRQLPALR